MSVMYGHEAASPQLMKPSSLVSLEIQGGVGGTVFFHEEGWKVLGATFEPVFLYAHEAVAPLMTDNGSTAVYSHESAAPLMTDNGSTAVYSHEAAAPLMVDDGTTASYGHELTEAL